MRGKNDKLPRQERQVAETKHNLNLKTPTSSELESIYIHLEHYAEAMTSNPKDPSTIALERFKNTLTRTETSQFNFATFDDVWTEVMKIQKEQGERRSLQNLARIDVDPGDRAWSRI